MNMACLESDVFHVHQSNEVQCLPARQLSKVGQVLHALGLIWYGSKGNEIQKHVQAQLCFGHNPFV